MRRFLILCVVIAAVCPVLFAGGDQEAKAAAAPASAVTLPGQLPIVKDKVTIKGFIPSIGFIKDTKTNASLLYLEEKTNVRVEWIESSKVDAKNKLSILLASGDYPEFIQGTNGAGLATADIPRYGKQGIFLKLNDLIEKQGFYIKEMFKAEPFVKSAITGSDGNIYGLPAVFTDDYHMTMRQKLWINQKWLDNLGLKMPKTTDEFYAVMKAFKEKDANGNGDPNDEIPLTGAKRTQEDLAMWIMNSFVVAGGPDESGDALLNCYEFIVNGKVFFNADKPEFREGLRFIAKLYKEGLIDKAALTQDKDQIKPLVDGGNASRIGAAASHHPGNFANMSSADLRYEQYVALPPLKGPKGNQTTPWFLDANVWPGQLIITDKAKNPDVIMRWADYYFSLDFGLHEKGVQGVHWDFAKPDEKLTALTGKPALYKYIKTITPEDNAQVNLGPGWTRNLKNEFASPPTAKYEEMLYNQTLSYDPYKVARFPYNTAAIPDADLAELTNLRKTIHSYIGESIDRFIIGDLNIETQWDSYVQQLNQIGLPRFMKILEGAYSASR